MSTSFVHRNVIYSWYSRSKTENTVPANGEHQLAVGGRFSTVGPINSSSQVLLTGLSVSRLIRYHFPKKTNAKLVLLLHRNKMSTAAPKKAAAAKPKIVVFKLAELDDEKMKRKRLVSLAKRAGLKANKNSAALKEDLKKYYEAHKSEIEEKQKELKNKPKASKKRDMTKDLQTRIHYKDRVADS